MCFRSTFHGAELDAVNDAHAEGCARGPCVGEAGNVS